MGRMDVDVRMGRMDRYSLMLYHLSDSTSNDMTRCSRSVNLTRKIRRGRGVFPGTVAA
jgi:hypothetical protein